MTSIEDIRVAELRCIWGPNGLSHIEQAVLARLLYEAYNDKPANLTRSCCSFTQIAESTGYSVRSVGTAHRSLRAQGVLVYVYKRSANQLNPGAYDVGFDLSRIPPSQQRAQESMPQTAAEERAAVLAWLRKVEDEGRGSTWQWADAIERGEHIVK